MDTVSLLRTCVALQRIALNDSVDLGDELVSQIVDTNRRISEQYGRIVLALLAPILGLEFSQRLLRKYLRWT
ncbi:MAG: hypothetical protein ACW99U_06535 [Candidatus Thorarchaeota archaeon]|jgi:hypothetical protein